MKKSVLMLILVLALSMLLTACGGGATTAGTQSTETPATSTPAGEEKTFHFIMGHGAAEGSIGDLVCKKFEELIEAKSNGKITADVYAGSQLGTYGEMLQGLKTGDVSGIVMQPAPAVSFIPELAMLDLPYAFYGLTQSQIDEILNNSEYSKILQESFDKAGYKGVWFAQAASFRETTSSKKINTIEDFKGLKLRVLENKYHLEFWKNVGASPTPLAFGELYLALQQGLVHAQENPYDTSLAAKFPEVQKYLIHTHHIIYPNLFIISKSLYESMPADYQAIFDQVAIELKQYAADLMEDSKKTNLEKLKEAGMTVIDLPEAEIQKLKDKAVVVEEMLKKDLGDQVVQTFLNSKEKAMK
ncbi:MAG TPA: TRAP transporter substrate-binding protein DctP [Sedimentibacter sp.]|nr:TRAP transporter substrate-binding protein DctP [Sedimentibacter sp.]